MKKNLQNCEELAGVILETIEKTIEKTIACLELNHDQGFSDQKYGDII